MILRKILQLDDTSGKSAGSVGTVILEHSSCPGILAHRCLHSGVFLHTTLGKLLTKRKYIRQMLWCYFKCLRHGLLAESIHFQSVIRKPPFHLCYGVGIVKVGQILNLLCEAFAADAVDGNSLLHKRHIQSDATVINFLIKMVFIPNKIGNRETGQLPLDAHLGFHITQVICLELLPLFHIVLRKIPGSAAIGLGRCTGYTEVFDEIFPLGQFLLLQSQNCTHSFQGQRQAECCRPHHRAVPAVRGEPCFKIIRQAHTLKLCVECPLDNRFIRQGIHNLRRNLLSACKVYNLDCSAIHTVTEQKDVEVRTLGIFINSGFLQIHTGVSFNINA